MSERDATGRGRRGRRPGLLGATPRNGLLLVVLLLALLVTACDGGRSTEAFCDAVASGHERFEGLLAEEPEGAMDAGRTVLAVREELQGYVEELEATAPDEIREDMERISESLDLAEDQGMAHIDDPLAMLATALATSLDLILPAERVESFAQRECGRSVVPGLAR